VSGGRNGQGGGIDSRTDVPRYSHDSTILANSSPNGMEMGRRRVEQRHGLASRFWGAVLPKPTEPSCSWWRM